MVYGRNVLCFNTLFPVKDLFFNELELSFQNPEFKILEANMHKS